ncbi:MAG: SDR family NAD(P)-dependent oxidoreductase [Planctomycetota bacterium]
MKFPHQVVLITGASSGIGEELAVQLAAFGCKLGLMARRKEKLEHVAQRVEDAGGVAMVLPCDVTDFDQIQDGINQFAEAHGPVDCVVANAGTGQQVDALKFDAAETARVVNVNLLGMVNAFYAAVPQMLERSHGHLVGVASLASYQGMPQDAGYAASKAAMRIHCESMRTELRGSGVDVTCICPGFIRTPMTDTNDFDMPFLLEVDDACRRIVRAIAMCKRVYNFPWQLWWLIKIGMRTPRWIYDAVISSQSSKTAKSTRKQARSTEDK